MRISPMMVLAAALVCAASFHSLPSGWHHGGSWAATPRSVYDLTKPLPSRGIYIWVSVIRLQSGTAGAPRLRLPLRLKDATLLAQEGAPRLPEYRFEGRYRRRYVTVGVDFGRPRPTPELRGSAERVLRGLVLPRCRG